MSISRVVRSVGVERGSAWVALTNPAGLLFILSIFLGTALALINPPLRGPDEPAHFVRIYAYTQGVFLPRIEVDQRKGIYLPARLHEEFALFQSHVASIWKPGFTFRPVMQEQHVIVMRRPPDDSRDPVFVPFEGSEGYTIVAYAPYVIAAFIAQLVDLDFSNSLLLMRLFGLAAFSAVAAYAVAVTPYLKWAFFLIAMFPAALYARSVVGADGATVSFTLVVISLSLRAVSGQFAEPTWKRAFWMTLCVLSKPPQVAFVLLEPMIHRFNEWPQRWRTILVVIILGLMLSLGWIWAVDAEMAAWRVYAESDQPAEHFSLAWKLRFMLEHPTHFPRIMLGTIFTETFGLWRQLIGVLGWLDTHFHTSIYVVISMAFLLSIFQPLDLPSPVKRRVAAYCLAVALIYTTGVFLILFITWTPPTDGHIWGVQGRYFVVLLPLIAISVAALCNLATPRSIATAAAISGAVLSGLACIEGLWRVNWIGH